MLKQTNCIKEEYSLNTLTLQADAGESFLVKMIYDIPYTGSTFLIARVDRKTVGAWRLSGRTGNHLGYPYRWHLHKNLMASMAGQGINVSIPVAEGQTLTLYHIGQYDHVVVIFDRYDAGDIRADMPNGTEAKEYVFVQYMDAATAPSASGDVLLDKSLSPAEFPDFPCGKVVPPRTKIDFLGLVGSPFVDMDAAADYMTTDYVKLIKEREVLFDEDRNGIPFRSASKGEVGTFYDCTLSLIGACVSVDPNNNDANASTPAYQEPLYFDQPLHFESGEELGISIAVRIAGSGTTLPDDTIDLAAILRVITE